MPSGDTGAEGATPNQPPTETPYPKESYAWYVVGVLMVVYIFSFIDRQILQLLVEDIKADLDLNDTQMGLLMGFSFAIFYSILGLPLGRLADYKNRKLLIAGGLTIWTIMTGFCGLAQKYWQLFLMRVGVGVGEATLSPSAYSIVTDYFPRSKLSRAMGVYNMGIFIGAGSALIISGPLTQWAAEYGAVELPVLGTVQPWQLVFIILGVVGFAPLLLLMTIKEPVRRGAKMVKRKDGAMVAAQTPLRDVFAYLGANWKTVACHNLGFAILTMSSYGLSSWEPTFMMRVHEWERAQAGLFIGGHRIIAGILGSVIGGILADRLIKRGFNDAPMRLGFLASLLWLPFGIAYPLVNNEWIAWMCMAVNYFFVAFPLGAGVAGIQSIMPNSMRGQASALYLFMLNFIGLGIGPTAVGWFTDNVFKNELQIGYSLLVVGVTAHIIGVFVFRLGFKPFRESVERLKAWEAANAG
jgi:MFS family permease